MGETSSNRSLLTLFGSFLTHMCLKSWQASTALWQENPKCIEMFNLFFFIRLQLLSWVVGIEYEDIDYRGQLEGGG